MSTLPGNPHADEAKTMTHRAGEGAKAISASESVICSMLAAQTATTLAVARRTAHRHAGERSAPRQPYRRRPL